MISEVVASHQYGIGIDPGWKNMGFAIVKRESEGEPIQLIHTESLNPFGLGGVIKTLRYVSSTIEDIIPSPYRPSDNVFVNIERYVPYNNTFTAEAENITMLIGALHLGLDYYTTNDVGLHRAIDWKMKMVKALFKWKKFQNPSDKLDKKFSFAAAKVVANVQEIETDHEADAICLAGIPFIPTF